MKKLLCLLGLVGACASAQLPYCTLTPADSVWNTAYDQTQYYWAPDAGQTFSARVYENVWNGSQWMYYPAGSIGFGSGAYAFYDNNSAQHGLVYDKCFVVFQHPASSYHYASSRGWLPQAWGSVDSWASLPGGMNWQSTLLSATGYTWEVWVCGYNRIVGFSYAQFVAGGYGSAPPSVDAYAAAYGQ